MGKVGQLPRHAREKAVADMNGFRGMFGWLKRYRQYDGPSSSPQPRPANLFTRIELGPDEWVEIRPKQFTVRHYKGHPENWRSSALIDTYGDVGWISLISGHDILNVLRDRTFEAFNAVGIRTLEGYVTDSSARLMRMTFRGGHRNFEVKHRGMCADREMPWVALSVDPDADQEPRHFGMSGK